MNTHYSARILVDIANKHQRLSVFQSGRLQDSLAKSHHEKVELESKRQEIERELSSLQQRKETLSSFGRVFSTISSVTNGLAATYLTTTAGSLFPAFVLTATLVNEALKRYNGWEKLYSQFTSSKPLQERLALATESAISLGSAYYSVSSFLQAGDLAGSAMKTLQSSMVIAQGSLAALRGETQYQTKKREAFSTEHTQKLDKIKGRATGATSSLKKTTENEGRIFQTLSRISASCLDLQLPLYAASPA